MFVKTTQSFFNGDVNYRQVNTLSFWKNNQLHIMPITKQNVEEFLSACGTGKNHIIVTSCNKMYYTPDTPGYSDGEVTTTVNAVIDGLETIVDGDKITEANMHDVIYTNGLAFYSDSGHGWLKVPLSLIRYLKINLLISGYSYNDGKFAYLEEDSDMARFFVAVGLPFNEETKQLFKRFWSILPQHNCDNSPIRNYPRYDNEKMASRFNQWSLGSLDKVVYALAKG